ncbi:MAG: SGNH/GDSL hydrolase family protein [Candidatus Magasanikbacteria bacterium]|nr:SGNH/GDSL hydrolase family protein [Candidatus Magasanikbacteria bacterium]MCA9391408.1 SGNH/GDSL hydrolase family protein [Candidatus Magasanikbacteria bacterium]HPF95478.1 SGNH/GDSL hydrolase family protein [bacterium]
MNALYAILTLLIIYFSLEYLKTSGLIRIGQNMAQKTQPFTRELNLTTERILIIGDSTAYGTGASSPETSLAGLLGKRYPNAAIINEGVNGMRIHELKEALEELDDESFRLIQIHIGGNDIVHGTDPAEYKKDLTAVLQKANTMSSHVILVTCGNVGTAPLLPYLSRWYFEKRTREIRDISIEVTKQFHVDYVDLFHEKDEDPFAQEPKKYYAKDLFHPSNDGYAFWYEQIRNNYPPEL